MKNEFFLILLIFICFCKNLREQKPDRLTFVQSFYPEDTYYIFNAEEEFVKHGFFEKDETVTNSGKYSYKWANQDKNTYVDLGNFLPQPDENGFRDFSNIDSLYITL